MRMKMKRVFRRNQIIITTLAIMIAAAGYLNYAGKSDLPGADTYELIVVNNGEKKKIIFEPNKTVCEGLKMLAPRKVFCK